MLAPNEHQLTLFEIEIIEEEKKIPEKLETYKEIDDEDCYANTKGDRQIMKTYLVIYEDDYPSYDIQTVEGYWDLRYEDKPKIIIELTDDMINDIKNLESKGE